MSYNPTHEASRALPVESIVKELEDFAATGQDLSGRRFSRSPPGVPSVPSTTYEESEPPSPNAQLQDKETLELENSTADAQFTIQIKDELDRIRTARDKDLLDQSNLCDLEEAAEANVKYRWIQQGIWDDRWANQPGKIWKHELQDPQLPGRPSGSMKEGGAIQLKTNHKRRHSELEEEYHEIVRLAVEYQDQQSSRPCYQFLYQLCQERDWIKMGLSNQDQDLQSNLEKRAYEILKSRWIRDGVWDNDWSFLPGISWRHERPRKTLDPKGRYLHDDAVRAFAVERAECPPRWYSMAPVAPLMRINWRLRQPVSLEAASDPSSRSTWDPSSSARRPPQDRSITSRAPRHTDSPGFMRKSTAKAKPAPKVHEHDKHRTGPAKRKPTSNSTGTSSNQKAVQKQNVATTQPYSAELRSARNRTSGNKVKKSPPTTVVRPEETAKNATTSRPRRAAASKAMKALKKTI